MSLVYITHHSENIFDVENDLKTEFNQPFKYVSKFKKRMQKQRLNVIEIESSKKLLTDSKKCARKTFGYAETPLNPPCAFLRKNQGVKWQRHKDHVCPKLGNMPSIPKFEPPQCPSTESEEGSEEVSEELSEDVSEELSEEVSEELSEDVSGSDNVSEEIGSDCRQKHRADFVSLNIERAKNLTPKRRPPRYVDTPKGDAHDVLNTGLVPQAICLKNFGKVPCYLRFQKRMLDEIRRKCHPELEQQQGKGAVETCPKTFLGRGIRQLTSKERHEILSGLRVNYKDLCKTYEGLPLYTDTVAKKLRKGKIENDLRQLEKDIWLVESNPVIFVSEY